MDIGGDGIKPPGIAIFRQSEVDGRGACLSSHGRRTLGRRTSRTGEPFWGCSGKGATFWGKQKPETGCTIFGTDESFGI
ncbi:hypothetical protein KY284_035842 [Solanum tuberosum]|nr:hypothetical protein KY284_035842 [Solanum tuberosum]